MFGWSLRTLIANLKSLDPVSFEIMAELLSILNKGGWGQEVLLWEIILDIQLKASVKEQKIWLSLSA